MAGARGSRNRAHRTVGATGPSRKAAEKAAQAAALVALANGADLFHDPEGATYVTYTVRMEGQGATPTHAETHRLDSRVFRLWLQAGFYRAHGKPAGAPALRDALDVLHGRALFDGPERRTAVRIAEFDGAIVLDLCDRSWRAVQVTSDGWGLVDTPPVRFVRHPGMLPLPEPTPSGSIEALRPLMNVDEVGWILVVAWLIGTFRPRGPHPILAISGEQGSAKTSLCRMIRGLIDPNRADLRAAPRDERDLLIAAENAWVLGFDNLSHVPPALSDALCRLATGSGFSTRELFSNGREKIFSATRPVMLNGIEDLTARPDLLERAIIVTLPAIADETRKSEAWIGQQYEEVRGGVLGALLTAVSTALRHSATVRIEAPPRMADFAAWVVAAEGGLSWQDGEFLAAYRSNREVAHDLAFESSNVGQAVLAFVRDRPTWRGTAADLLAALEDGDYAGARSRQRADWPRNPRAFGSALRRIVPTLRQLGVNARFDREPGGNRRRLVVLEQAGSRRPDRPGSSRGGL